MADDEEIRRNRWLDEEGELFEFSGQCPAPSKDFSQIVVSPTEVNSKYNSTSKPIAKLSSVNRMECSLLHFYFSFHFQHLFIVFKVELLNAGKECIGYHSGV